MRSLSSPPVTAPPVAPTDVAPQMVSAGWIVAALFALIGGDTLLLPRFLGVAHPVATMLGGLVVAGLCIGAIRGVTAGIPLRRLAICVAIGFALMILGGQGHVFYANIDWQVRDAALADMIRWPWPFAYIGHGAPAILRAPIGIYLLPALAGKLGGLAFAQWVLLGQDGLMLGALLALASLLAPDRRGRTVLLVVATVFSGMDTLGAMLTRHVPLWPITANIQGWGPTIFSSHVAMVFWVPQHAISGWLGAIFFMLWNRRIVPLWLFLSIVPLAALWSPLGAIGTLPFAALAGLTACLRRELRPQDVLAPAAASATAVVPLLYMAADAGTVGMHRAAITPLGYGLFECVEVVPYLVAVGVAIRGGKFGLPTFLLVLACLAIFPLVAVGESVDFAMRATIPALAILSVLVAQALEETLSGSRPSSRLWPIMLMLVLFIGALTPLREVARAILLRPTPPPLCDVSRAWDQSFAKYGKETYFARLSSLPPLIRPARVTAAPPVEPAACWIRPWKVPRLAD